MSLLADKRRIVMVMLWVLIGLALCAHFFPSTGGGRQGAAPDGGLSACEKIVNADKRDDCYLGVAKSGR